MTAKKSKKPSNSSEDIDREFLILGHFIKYNLYLLAKSVVFSAISQKVDDSLIAANLTNKVIEELDLDTKRRVENTNTLQQDELQ